MGQLRNATAQDVKAFPGCTFAVNNSVPEAQCLTPPETDLAPTWSIGASVVTPSIALADIWLVDKSMIVAGSPADNGVYLITAQSGDLLTLNHVFIGLPGGAIFIVTDVGRPNITRNEQSFSRFLQANTEPQTFKGGQLYTSSPDPPFANACPTAFNPD